MGELKIDRFYSVEDYLSILEESEKTKYEYVGGYLYAMAGGTIKHNQIGRNLIISIGLELRLAKSSCQVFGSDQRVSIKAKNSYFMPDVSAVCDPIESDEEDPDSIVNPVLVIEVLSKSTISYDKTQKFGFYRTLDSLQEYVLIWQNDPIVETYHKNQNGSWEIKTYFGLDQKVQFNSLGISIEAGEIFRDLKGINPGNS